MNKAASEAMRLLHNLGCTDPKDMTMEEIAWACDLMVEKKGMVGSEGRILMNASAAIISINSNITYQPKINFILAHEIGHAILHRKKIPLFSDSDKTLNEWYASGNHEIEANLFATELLMPTNLFINKIAKKKLNLSLIEDVAHYFDASKTTTFLRYRDLGEFPLMIIFIVKGLIKWKTCSIDFPFKWLPLNSEVPIWTVAGDYFHKGIIDKNPVKVNAMEWFPEDFNIVRNKDQKLWEQCFRVNQTSFITCLWTK